VDPGVIQNALAWVVSKQQRDGSFKEDGEISHKVQSDPVTLTSMVVLGFLDNKRNLTSTVRNSMNKAIDYIALNWETLEDPYYLSVVTYALHRALHPSKDPSFAAFDKFSTETKDKKWWPMLLPEDWKRNPRSERPNTLMIETAGYALLTLAARGSISDAVPVVNWLFSQQNSHGGYVSTSDTYVALKALAEFNIGFSIQDRNTDMSIQYAFLDNVKRMEVTSAYPIRMLRSSLPEETDQVRIRATGSGVAVLQVNHEYNLDVTSAWPAFVLNPIVSRVSNAHHVQITACTHFIQLTSIESSLMSVMEIYMPSGFTVNQDTLPAINRFKNVKRVETEKEGTKVVIYFSHVEKDKELCPTIQAFRTHRVANQRPAHVLIYDYYDQTKFARSFYDVVPATLCDICEGEDCPESGCSRNSLASPYYEGNPFDDAYVSGRLGNGVSVLTSKPLLLATLAVCSLMSILFNH
jgi:CD109 antigen